MIETVIHSSEDAVMHMKAGGWIVIDKADRDQRLGSLYVYDVSDEMIMADYPSVSCSKVIGRVISVHYD